ncbi:GNAT family N-acetyltransferase [Shewanella mangrovisoli]|uniref:GNAT family N-acetyltransferase n=1 Tax=Shewanella mangrovisoli TaxID=2864211 RepID=UPI0035B784AE
MDKQTRVSNVTLRPIGQDDLELIFTHQQDPIASQLAQFPSREREAFYLHWQQNILGQASVLARGIEVDGLLVGNIGHWHMDGQAMIGYWIDRAFWGRGVATLTLSAFLPLVTSRPIFAHVAQHNVASQRVLLRHGFVKMDRLIQEEGDAAPLFEFVLA